MQVMDDRNKSLSSNLAQINAKGALEDAKQLEEMFVEVEDYFAHKSNANDAVDWSKQSRELASTITKYVASNVFDHASESAATLSKTCKTCHRIYKKKD